MSVFGGNLAGVHDKRVAEGMAAVSGLCRAAVFSGSAMVIQNDGVESSNFWTFAKASFSLTFFPFI
jgi:hypothetical protein